MDDCPKPAAATAKSSTTLVFDKSVFLLSLEGDEVLGREIIEIFLHECPRLIEDVRRAAEQQNASSLERAAHALKGNVGDVAAPRAFDCAHLLEQMGRDGQLAGAKAALINLEIALEQLVLELRRVESKAA